MRLDLIQDDDGYHGVHWESGSARVQLDEAHRITSIAIDDPTPEKLRSVPLGRIAAAVLAGGLTLERLTGKPRYRLRRPPGKRLPDTFYANVATAYRAAVARGMKPRQALAADTGAADATVAAWIMEARKRGHLPPAEPGKVSA